MGRHHRGSSGGYSSYSGRPAKLFHKNSVYGYEDSENEKTEKIPYKSAEEYLASLPTERRCEGFARFYEMVLRSPVDLDEAATAKAELAKCPERFIKIMEKIEKSSSKLSGERIEETRESETMEEHFARLPLDRRCSVLTSLYKMAILGRYKDPEFAVDVRRWMVGCPESYYKVISEIDNFSSKLSS